MKTRILCGSKHSRLVLCAALWLWAATSVLAQSYSIDWSSVDGGEIGTRTGGAYSLSGTIGQPDAGRLSGGSYTLEGGFWAGVAALQTPGAPWLSITRTNGSVVISWPPSDSWGWVLEHTNRLTSATNAWPQVPLPYQTNATQIFITVPAPAGNGYYRLRKE